VHRFEELALSRIEAGVNVTVIIGSFDRSLSGDYNYLMEMAEEMKNKGIFVVTLANTTERFAIIDDIIVWHGSVNFLGKDDYWDNLIRIESESVAAELKEMTLLNQA